MGIMKRPEEAPQRSAAHYLSVAVPLPPEGPLWFHVPNGGGRSKAEGGILKAMGVKSGIGDLVFLTKTRPFCIELKAGKGKLSESQKWVMSVLNLMGIHTYVVRNLEELKDALRLEGVKTKDVFAGGRP